MYIAGKACRQVSAIIFALEMACFSMRGSTAC
jgi:hypothetical protein